MRISRSGSQPSGKGPGERHWHAASPTAAMQHLAVQEALDGKAVDWLEHVTDAEYSAQSGAGPDAR